MGKVEGLFQPAIMLRENLECAVRCQYLKLGGGVQDNLWEMLFTIAEHIDYTAVHQTE